MRQARINTNTNVIVQVNTPRGSMRMRKGLIHRRAWRCRATMRVEAAQGVKSNAQRWIDQFGDCYSRIVLAVALLRRIPSALTGMPGTSAAVFVHEAGELVAVTNGLRTARRMTSCSAA